MDKELKEKWIADLRTPGRKQANERLCNGHGAYCCLGRLAIVAGHRVCSEDRARSGDTWRAGEELSPSGLAEFGLSSNQHDMLIAMNDIRSLSFPEIADWIESNL